MMRAGSTRDPRRVRRAGAGRSAGLRIALALVLALVLFAGFGVARLLQAGDRDVAAWLAEAPPMQILDRAEADAEVRADTPAATRHRRLELTDRIGAVQATVRYAADGAGPVPAIIVIGGLRTGRRAVDLLDPDLPYVVAALDHAWTGPQRMNGAGLLMRTPDIQRDLLRTTVALRDLARHLASDPRVAGGRVYLVGASIGSPIAAASAIAVRPAGLCLLFGFADHAAVIEYRLRSHVRFAPARRAIARAGAALTANLDAMRTLPRLCGTPVLVVASPEDRELPRRCTEALWNATCEPRELVELAGGHIQGRRELDVLRQTVAIAGDWVARTERSGRSAAP